MPADPAPRRRALSKSRFCAGLQCLRQLWWRVHEPDAPELRPDEDLAATFARGHRVGETAHAAFPGGVLVDREPWEIAEKVEDTRAALEAGAPAVFEASFVADGVFVAVDVLERAERGHVLVEVKSTYRVKPQFVPDVAIQVHVARAAGIDVARAEVMHLDPRAAREATGGVGSRRASLGGEGAPEPPRNEVRFVRADVTAEVEAFLPSVPAHLRRMDEALAGGLPPPTPATRCSDPYDCPFEGRCRAERAGA
jgi:hypothetical protein